MENIYLTWNKSQRSISISKEFSLLHLAIEPRYPPILRFSICSIWATFKLLYHRPKTIFIQYSFLLLPIVNAYRTILSPKSVVVVDCHTKALRRSHKGVFKKIFNKIKKSSFSDENIYLIHNNEQKPDIELYTKSYIIYNDPLPSINQKSNHHKIRYSTRRVICFICSYDTDEPFEEMLKSAASLSSDYDIVFTGSAPKRVKKKSENLPIKFTGYLARSEYEKLITSSTCIVSLTEEDGCLQCAVYEAISIGVPCVTSKTLALCSAFGSAVRYVENSSESICNGIITAINDRESLIAEMDRFRKNFVTINNSQKLEIINKMASTRKNHEYC